MVSTTGTRWRCGEGGQRRLGAAVAHAAAGDQQRLLGRAQQVRRLPRAGAGRARGRGMWWTRRLEEALGIVERLGLHVLAQADEGRAAIGRVEQHAQRLGQRLEQLLGPGDPVPVAGDRLEGVVDAERRVAPVLDLLQHRVGQAARRSSRRESSRTGRRLVCATPAAVTMLVAPGPIELAATMICRRALALAKPIAASAIDCSFWPRQVGSSSLTASSASLRQVTLPWPKIANTPGNSGTSAPSISVRCAISQRTSACAMVSRMVVMRGLPGTVWCRKVAARRRAR